MLEKFSAIYWILCTIKHNIKAVDHPFYDFGSDCCGFESRWERKVYSSYSIYLAYNKIWVASPCFTLVQIGRVVSLPQHHSDLLLFFACSSLSIYFINLSRLGNKSPREAPVFNKEFATLTKALHIRMACA